ncbi:MAG: S24/S26 family peptidase [Methanobrevibacter sp.]|jgi:hypothetical protein|nr:S24/S26 family peptidase [Candidatus Methanoflexus mossambicus]
MGFYNKKFLIPFIILLIIIVSGLILFSDDVTINIYLNGTNSSVNSQSIPFLHDNANLNNEILYFINSDKNDLNSNIDTVKGNISLIAKNYGFNDININLKSQFGENVLPMMIVVSGRSMMPTIHDGENIIVEKTKNIHVNDIVVVNDNEYGLIIKRVGAINDNQVYLISDNVQETLIENGVPVTYVGLRKWTNINNIIGIARIFNVNVN